MFKLSLFQGLNESRTAIIRTLKHCYDSVIFNPSFSGEKRTGAVHIFSLYITKNENFLATKKCMGCLVFICRSLLLYFLYV